MSHYQAQFKSQRGECALYGVPDNLLVVDLAKQYPDLKGKRLRGRIDGVRTVIPLLDSPRNCRR